MANAVFLHKPSSKYDDNPTERYHFPHIYLRVAEQTVGDHIVYFEPKRDGAHGYVAIAQVTRIDPDPSSSKLFYARIDPASYVPFLSVVRYEGAGGIFEHALRMPDGSVNQGLRQRAVRPISRDEFNAIVSAGMTSTNDAWLDEAARFTETGGFSDQPQTTFGRSLVTVTRKLRDAAFKRQIREAYNETCAISGLRIINGGGRPEVQAAHIQSVEDNGPDWVRNGIALSGTIHWMFDRGLVSVADDLKILRAEKLIPDEIRLLLSRSEYLLPPKNANFAPHPEFLRHHREHRYKGD
ncbi:MAG: HNH endonuclease [Cucumibacter sp.]